MADRTPDEALRHRIEKLGEERGRYVNAVENDLFNLRIHTAIYEALFGTNKERVDLFNAISGSTAYWMERSMFESLVLQICRLTDPVKSNGEKKNVTVKNLPSQLSAHRDAELEVLITKAEAATKFARDWRNKRIAHADEEVRLGKATLDAASRAKLKEATDAIAACVKRCALVELNITLITHPVRGLIRDEVSFLTALYYGNRELERISAAREELLKKGDWREIDELEVLPEWLTKRSETIIDAE